MTYGTSDLLTQPLNVTEPSELRITLSLNADVKPGSVNGHVIGLNPNHGSVQIVLSGVTAFSSFESNVDSFGSFNFSDVPQGAYVLSLQGAIAANLNPSSIVVSGIDLNGLDVAVLSSTAARPRADDPPAGATVSDLGGSSPDAANESAAVAGLRTINTAEVTFLVKSGGKYGSVTDLVTTKLLDNRFLGPVSGFLFSIIVAGLNYAIAAVPVSAEAGRYAFYSTPDGVIRYSASELLAPVGQMGLPVQ
jgi:hypothetical protein